MKNILIIAFWMLSLSVADAQIISNVTYDDKNYLDYLNIFNEDSNRNNYNSEIIDDLLPVLFNYLKDKIQLP